MSEATNIQVIDVPVVNNILEKTFKEIADTTEKCHCGSCDLRFDCDHAPFGNQTYCTAKKFKQVMFKKMAETDKGIRLVSDAEWKRSPHDDTVICSNCGEEHYIGAYHQYNKNYCPNCGVKMN